MRCRCCDVELSTFEATRKSKSTGEYLDMCNVCYASVAADIPAIIRKDLQRSPHTYIDTDDQYDDIEEYDEDGR